MRPRVDPLMHILRWTRLRLGWLEVIAPVYNVQRLLERIGLTEGPGFGVFPNRDGAEKERRKGVLYGSGATTSLTNFRYQPTYARVWCVPSGQSYPRQFFSLP